jgi:hypothetical protein
LSCADAELKFQGMGWTQGTRLVYIVEKVVAHNRKKMFIERSRVFDKLAGGSGFCTPFAILLEGCGPYMKKLQITDFSPGHGCLPDLPVIGIESFHPHSDARIIAASG